MKTLLVSSTNFSSTYGGGQVYLKNIVEEFIRQQKNIVVAEPGEGSMEIETYKGVPIYSFNKMGDALDFTDFLKELKPDIVHAHGYKAEFAKACAYLDIPCVITAHHGGILCPAGTLLNHKEEICMIKASPNNCLPCVLKRMKGGRVAYPVLSKLPLKWRMNTSRFIKRVPFIYGVSPILSAQGSIQNKLNNWQEIDEYASEIISPSYALAESMKRNGIDANKIKVVPHGIPFPNSENTKQVVQHDKPLRFFYVGRINYIKGVHIMIKAFQQTKTNAELNIIGGAGNKQEGNYMKQLKRSTAKNNRIKWYGKVDKEKVNELIQSFDVLIHPTIAMEIYGLNIAEALALGKPVIATKCGGAEMQIAEGENGLLVAPNDIEALKESILKVIDIKVQFAVNKKKINSIQNHVKDLIAIYEAYID